MAGDSKPTEIQPGAPGMVEFPGSAERLPGGNTLIADGGDELGRGSEVLEVDPAGNLVWQYGDGGRLSFAHTARRLPGGNTLITDTTAHRVIEVSPEKKIVWTSEQWSLGSGRLSDGSHLDYPNEANMLPAGELIICDRNNDRALIVDRSGQLLWEYSRELLHPHNAQILAGGNLLICDSDHNRVLEISREKKVVWSYGDGSPKVLCWPRSARRLQNGHTLIADSRNSRVIQVTPLGEAAWQYEVDYQAKFFDVQPLPGGSILLSDQGHRQVLEVDAGGVVRWRHRNFQMTTAIEPKLMNGFFAQRDPQTGLPAHWDFACRHNESAGRFIWDEASQPRPCPGLELDGRGFVYLTQTVAVSPGGRYHLAAKVKTQGVENWAAVIICFLDQYGGMIHDLEMAPRGNLLMGDQDWALETTQAIAPEQAVYAEVRLLLHGRGRAWITDVIFHQ